MPQPNKSASNLKQKRTTRPSRAESTKSKKEKSSFDIVDAVKRDHEDLKKFITVMKDEDAEFEEKNEAYQKFSSLLKSHASSEEAALYQKCIKEDDMSVETNEAFVEHQLAALLMNAIDATRDRDRREAQIKVLAENVEHHIEEEEDEFLPDVEKEFSEGDRAEMAEQFLSLRKKSQSKYSDENAGVLEEFLH